MKLPALGRFQLADRIADWVTHGAYTRHRDRAALADARGAQLAAAACRICGCPIAPGFGEQHARWHYGVAMTTWAAGGGRARKPPMPPFMREERRRRTAEQAAAVLDDLAPRGTG